MNPDQPSREQIETRITALLLGELPAEEAALLRYTISQDQGLQQLHDELQATLVLVREAAKHPEEPTVEQAKSLKLSADRRQKLLAHFKTPSTNAPKDPLFWLKRIKVVPRPVEILVVVAIIGLFAVMLLPSLSHAKRKSQSRGTYGTLSMVETLSGRAEQASSDNVKRAAVTVNTVPPGHSLPDEVMAPLASPTPSTLGVESQSAGTPATPPTTKIILPQTEQPSETLAQAGTPAEAGTGHLYSQNVVGYVNIPPGTTLVPFTTDTKSPSAPAKTESDAVTLNYATQNREKELERLWKVPGQSPDLSAASQPAGAFPPTVAGGPMPTSSNPNSQSFALQQRYFNTPLAMPPAPPIVAAPAPIPAESPLTQSAERRFSSSFRSRGAGGLAGNSSNNRDSAPESDFAFTTPATVTLPPPQPLSASAPNAIPPSVANGDNQDVYVFKMTNGNPELAAQVLRDMFHSPSDAHQYNSGLVQGMPSHATAGSALQSRASNAASYDYRPQVAVDSTQAETNAAFAGGGGAGGTTFQEGRLADAFNMDRVKKDQESTTSGVANNTFSPGDQIVPPGLIDFEGMDLNEVLKIYGKLVNRTVLRGSLPDAQIVLKNDTPLTKTEAIEKLQAVLAQNGVSVVNIGDKYVKALPSDQAAAAGQAIEGLGNASTSAQKIDSADLPVRKPAPNSPVPQPEILTRDNNFSTFSLNVSDVSFKLAEASLQNGKLPDTASIRSEEFINAFDYRDPEAAPGQPMAFTSERARYPFAHNREMLRFAVKAAATGRQQGRALNLVLLLDNSGSMERADRVAIIREALRVLATQLQPQDTVSVVTFSRTARLWADGVSGDKAAETFDRVGGITPEGGTNLEEAMRLAYETAHRHYLANGMNRVVLLTDGAANLGNVDPNILKQKVEAQRKQGIALDCFGVGWEDYNDDLLEQLSSNGDGRYAFLNSPEDAAKDFAAKLAGALQITAADVKVQVEFNPQRVISYRQIGYATHQLTKEQFRDNTVAAGQIAAQEAGNALYTIETNPNGSGPIATVHVRYRIPGTDEYREHSWNVDYTGSAPALEKSSPAMRLAASASAFSEWLAASPYAQEVTPDALLNYLSGVPEIYGADDRPKQLETMIREAKSLEGK